MNDSSASFRGILSTPSGDLGVRAAPSSRFSLWLDFDEFGPGDVAGEYPSFELATGDRTLTMGPCRVLREAGPGGKARYRLVPMGSMYDFDKLATTGRVATLESASVNLQLILSYKERIDPDFASYVSDLTYDLSAYRALFDELDEETSSEPPQVRELLSLGVLRGLGEEFLEYLDMMYGRLVDIVSRLPEGQVQHHGYYFRRQLWSSILSAPIMARTNLKPRGYIGDSEMMRMIYFNDYRGDSTFGSILHRHAVGQPAAQAVRNRRVELANLVRDFVERRTKSAGRDQVSILSVACGPAMELNEILRTPEDCARIHYSLLDQDKSALQEAATGVEHIEKRLGTSVSVRYLQESVRTLLVNRALEEHWGNFDFIYSMGLFDYLTRPVAAAVLRKLYALLLPGGEMIIGNFSKTNPTLPYMSFWMDWAIIHRSDEEMMELAEGLPGAKAAIRKDETGIQLLLHVLKE